jgi:hypothetical protein
MKKSPKNPHFLKSKKYCCDPCYYSSNSKKDFNKHLSTTKHLRLTSTDAPTAKKIPPYFSCETCGKKYKHRQSLFNHKKICKMGDGQLAKLAKKLAKVSHPKFHCECGKSYKHASSLSKHKIKCIYSNDVVDDNEEITEIVPNNNVEVLLKAILKENQNIAHENKVLRDKLSNLEMNVTNITNNNTNNNQFNINMFLNEKCKNAMNLEDFIQKIKFTLEDLQYTRDNGYTKGISNVFIKSLNDMDVTERPIHCSDQKRLQFYVKNDDEWTRDRNNEKIDSSIEKVSKKQLKSIKEWVKSNPDYLDSEKKTEEYFTMVNKITQPNSEKNLRNIKRKVGENVKLEKYENVK